MLALDVLEVSEIDSDLEIGGRTGIVPHARKAEPSFFNEPVEGKNLQAVVRSTAQVQRAWLPNAQQRNRPDPMPAILLGQVAVDLRWQGQGIARSLMFYALTTAVRLSEQVGCFCVLTHPLDDDVRALYAAFGFEDLPFDPARSMAVRIADLVRSGFGAAD